MFARTVGWIHVSVDDLEHLTAQKLYWVTSAMCWYIVLLETEHVFINAADHWQQS